MEPRPGQETPEAEASRPDLDLLFTGFYERFAFQREREQVFMTPGYVTLEQAVERIAARLAESQPGDLVYIDLIVHKAR